MKTGIDVRRKNQAGSDRRRQEQKNKQTGLYKTSKNGRKKEGDWVLLYNTSNDVLSIMTEQKKTAGRLRVGI
ncbi:hypothetical protein BC829DRAFT_60197 [Chytridium lagenaria]|nr:hypothetical protein BC829DRAFT_60197 [Chytridium lagenaria]